jgi:anthranilate synthase component 1
MYQPTLAEVRQRAAEGTLVPVYREILADLETPVSAFLKIARGPGSFLLESVEGGERLARYSFIGTEPLATLRLQDGLLTRQSPQGQTSRPFRDPLVALAEELRPYRFLALRPELPRFTGGLVGYLSYDAARYFERLPVPAVDPWGLPEAIFFLVDTLLIFDHLRRRIMVVSHADLRQGVERGYGQAVERIECLVERLRAPLPPIRPGDLGRPRRQPLFTANLTPAEHAAMVERAKRYIVEGDIIQVVLSLRLTCETPADPFTIYRALRTINPSPYMYYLDLGEAHIIGASPELLVRVEDGLVHIHPIAGTRRRGATPEEDLALEAELRQDEKERAEHIMLLDLGRNDVGRVSEPGSVRVTQLMEVERYSHVMHLVSHVTGRLRRDLTPLDALRAGFPAGTVSGAPKIRAMEIIAELEPDRRGPYAGAVGYVGFSGNLDTAIAIRTIVLKGRRAMIQAGGGIVADSTPEREYEEAMNKARATLQAIALAEEMEREHGAPDR